MGRSLYSDNEISARIIKMSTMANSFIKSKFSAIYLCVIAYTFLLVVVCLATGFNGLYGQDSYEYLRFSKALHAYFETGKEPGSFFWPVGYPLAGFIVGFIVKNITVAMLLVTIVSSAFTLLFLYKIIVLIYKGEPKSVNIFLILFFFLSPFVFRSSLVIMSDMMTVAGISMSFYYFLYFFQYKNLCSYLLFVLFASVSVTTRYAAIVVLAVPIISAIYSVVKSKKYFYLPFAGLIALLVFVPHLYLKSNAPFAFVYHEWMIQWSILNFFKNTFSTVDGLHYYSVVNSVYVFSNCVYPGYVFVGIFFLWFFKKEILATSQIKIILFSILLYAFFLAGMPIQNQRFLLLTYPLVLLLFYPSFSKIIQKEIIGKHFKIVLSVTVLIQFFFIYRALLPQLRSNKSEKLIVSSVKKYADRKIIYTSGMEGALNAYGVTQELKSLYLEKIIAVQPNSLLLINPPEIEVQWQGKNPSLNWNFIKNHYTIIQLESLPNGWELYEIR